ncbi:MAG: putative immunity protein [Anaerolineaceae bacterium]
MTVEEAKRFDRADQRALACWAADCAERVLPYFEEKHPGDDRPRKAIEAARAWARGEITCGEARAAAVAAHSAAREAGSGAACAVARAAGHAAATAHMPGHARHAAAYALTATTPAGAAHSAEADWQEQRFAEHLRPAVLDTPPSSE